MNYEELHELKETVELAAELQAAATIYASLVGRAFVHDELELAWAQRQAVIVVSDLKKAISE
jgi:hypothetical protein